tara:strand:+ start:206 stop:523 length:318 start_codon:yes stop_codon:yes gene_type:complete
VKNKPKKHVFVCVNCRDSKRRSCGEKGLEIRTKLLMLSKDDKDVRINKSGCLDMCEKGPAIAIYPERIWYKKVQVEDCDEIYLKSIKNSEVVSRLEIKEEEWNTK